MFSTKVRLIKTNKSVLRRNITTVLRSQKALLQQHTKPTFSLISKREYALVVDIKEFGAESIVEGTVQKWTKQVGMSLLLFSQ